MDLRAQEVLPVVFSIAVIILVAVVRKHSKRVAAITALIPLGATWALWAVYAANRGDRIMVTEFNRGIPQSVLPTPAFPAAARLATRTGLRL